jgi:hypothetical protein
MNATRRGTVGHRVMYFDTASAELADHEIVGPAAKEAAVLVGQLMPDAKFLG